MLGVYDYTVVLTYLSLISANVGIVLALVDGNVYLASICLMLSGLFDGFDGKVARTKKNRTEYERKFGIQIDSLTDIVAFCVLPACIAVALMRDCPIFGEVTPIFKILVYAVVVLFVVAGLIRLAHFNVTEDERQQEEGGVNQYYTGVPVTMSCLVFPTIILIQYISNLDLTFVYLIFIIIMGFAFVSTLKVKKAKTKHILLMVGIGVVEVLIMVLFFFLIHNKK